MLYGLVPCGSKIIIRVINIDIKTKLWLQFIFFTWKLSTRSFTDDACIRYWTCLSCLCLRRPRFVQDAKNNGFWRQFIGLTYKENQILKFHWFSRVFRHGFIKIYTVISFGQQQVWTSMNKYYRQQHLTFKYDHNLFFRGVCYISYRLINLLCILLPR